jgi:putative transcriptional regulator
VPQGGEKMRVRNNLRILMAKKGVKSVSQLSRETGLCYETLLNFYHHKYEVFNNKVVSTLCEFFDCSVGDLLELDKKVS